MEKRPGPLRMSVPWSHDGIDPLGIQNISLQQWFLTFYFLEHPCLYLTNPEPLEAAQPGPELIHETKE